MEIPKISKIEEVRHVLDVDWLAKEALSDDEYIQYKSKDIKDPLLAEKIKRNFIFPLDKISCRFEMNPSPPEVTNALQKACTVEQDGVALQVDDDNLKTNDENLNRKELLDNINLLPLRYGIKKDEIKSIELSLNVYNKSNEVMEIKAGDIKVKGYKLKDTLFLPSTQLIFLNPGRGLEIDSIRIIKFNTEDHIKFNTAISGAIWPLDRKRGDSTTNSTPLHHEVKFIINCVAKNDKMVLLSIIRDGCDNLIMRLRVLLDIILRDDPSFVEKYSDKYVLQIQETNCIGKMLERVCYNLFPKVPYISAEVLYHTKIMTVTITGTDARTMLLKTVEQCISIFENIKRQLI
uniref:Uncharacterized protein n=1 Tax=viral metagenome TaxID=1070528 RepID=A0A6C0LKW6_9ZZZZ